MTDIALIWCNSTVQTGSQRLIAQRRRKMIELSKLMRGIITVTTLLFLATSSATLSADEKTLYDKIGGTDGITTVVEAFLANVGADDRINARFANTNLDNLKMLLIEQVCEATGGPCAYSGKNMLDAHKGMDITEGEFGALAEQMSKAMLSSGVGQAEHDTIMGVLGGMHDDIVGQ